jgi:AmiR/NasT family two-component response regulator
MSVTVNSVLIVEDEFFIADIFEGQIEAMGLAVCGIAGTADQAVALALEHRPALVLMDVRLKGDADGVDAALAIHRAVGSKVIFITGSREPANVERMRLDHATAVLFKPIYGRTLETAVEAALSLPRHPS